MTANLGVLVDQTVPGSLRIAELPEPEPHVSEAVIRVAATSLNRGEVRMAGMGQNGRRIGWDFAGVVEKAAASGLGPRVGERVVGMLSAGAWAQRIAAPVEALAVLPDKVSFAQAATLPVAGLTALYGLEKGDGLLGRKVLITGGTGGVGHLAIQLASLGGAFVVATVRSAEQTQLVRAAGAHEVVIGEDSSAIGRHGPYDIILDGVGGSVLGAAASQMSKNGICVIYGATGGGDVTFNVRAFYATGGARLYGFILFHELRSVPASVGLHRLATLVADGRLRPLIDSEVPLSQIAELSQKLTERKFTGKAVVSF